MTCEHSVMYYNHLFYKTFPRLQKHQNNKEVFLYKVRAKDLWRLTIRLKCELYAHPQMDKP